MRFGENFLEELKARIRPSEVIGKHVKLKRQGREFAGLSPFTNEKTPSFFVNDEKGFYHCFSSGKHGDIISFLMESEGLSFPEAVEQIANMVGMALPAVDPEAEKRAIANKKTISWIEQAQSFFEKSLRREAGATARQYLQNRGLDDEACAQFGIGYAPDSFNALRDELVQQGASLEQLIAAGLLVKPEDSNKQPWDRFRHRIMFPIKDPRGRLIAFGGRALKDGEKAKYLNSPETSIFHKGKVLYRYPEARKALHAPSHGGRGMIVAEGYMDVIALARAGFEHAVAPLGTALTEDQLELLWRSGPEPILCFDGDKAGIRAAFRSVERALPLIRPGASLRFAMLPDGLDPDDLIAQDGATAMGAILERSISLVDMVWRREIEAEPLDTPEAKAGLKDRIFQLLREIKHDAVRDQYKTDLLARFDKEFGRPKRQSSRNGTGYWKDGSSAKQKPSALQTKNMQSTALSAAREKRLLGAVLEWPELLEHVDQTLLEISFFGQNHKKLQNSLLNYWQSTISVEKRALHAHIEQDGLEAMLNVLIRERNLIISAMGGKNAEFKHRVKIWLAEAKALHGQKRGNQSRSNTRGRMADTIRSENTDALQRLMRTSLEERKK